MSDTTQLTRPTDDGAAPHSDLIGVTKVESRRLMEAWWREMIEADEAGRPVANVFVMGSVA